MTTSGDMYVVEAATWSRLSYTRLLTEQGDACRLVVARRSSICVSATTLPFRDASFDRIVLVTVPGEVPDRAAAFRELARMLRDGGVVAITEPLPDPDVIADRRLIREASAVGLAPTTRTGSWFS